MAERKKPEREDTGSRERRENSQERAKDRANIAGEEYVSPREASPAYAPSDEYSEATCLRETGRMTCSEDEARRMRRANLAGESYTTPAKKADQLPPGKKRSR